jgi:glycosyltransferase involved in cell wall biosynthesis
MKILMVLTGTFPSDSRVEKEATSLSKNGHDVHLLCYATENTPLLEKTNFCTIHRVYFHSFFRNKISALALVLPFFFLCWRNQIKKLHKTYSFDAIHIHDLPLSKVGYFFKKTYDCKLVCDQHEFYSNWIRETAHMNTTLGKIISRLSNWERYEEKYLKLADLVITVAKPLEENYVEKYSLPNNKIITVPNTPAQKVYNKQNVKKSIIEKYKNNFTLFYAGGIDILRGIDTAIIALKKIKETIPPVKLVLCGRITKSYDPFKTASENGVAEYLEFKGWIDEQELPSYITASSICFFTPPATRDEINKTIATKIYQYAIMGKPIIVSDAKMMKEFVEQNNLGISIETENSEQFADAVLKIHTDMDKYTTAKITKDWYWEDTVKPMVEFYSNKLK